MGKWHSAPGHNFRSRPILFLVIACTQVIPFCCSQLCQQVPRRRPNCSGESSEALQVTSVAQLHGNSLEADHVPRGSGLRDAEVISSCVRLQLPSLSSEKVLGQEEEGRLSWWLRTVQLSFPDSLSEAFGCSDLQRQGCFSSNQRQQCADSPERYNEIPFALNECVLPEARGVVTVATNHPNVILFPLPFVKPPFPRTTCVTVSIITSSFSFFFLFLNSV